MAVVTSLLGAGQSEMLPQRIEQGSADIDRHRMIAAVDVERDRLDDTVVEKGITVRQYRASRWDVILGCLFTDIVSSTETAAAMGDERWHALKRFTDREGLLIASRDILDGADISEIGSALTDLAGARISEQVWFA